MNNSYLSSPLVAYMAVARQLLHYAGRIKVIEGRHAAHRLVTPDQKQADFAIGGSRVLSVGFAHDMIA
jgi:hypothetical protein